MDSLNIKEKDSRNVGRCFVFCSLSFRQNFLCVHVCIYFHSIQAVLHLTTVTSYAFPLLYKQSNYRDQNLTLCSPIIIVVLYFLDLNDKFVNKLIAAWYNLTFTYCVNASLAYFTKLWYINKMFQFIFHIQSNYTWPSISAEGCKCTDLYLSHIYKHFIDNCRCEW